MGIGSAIQMNTRMRQVLSDVLATQAVVPPPVLFHYTGPAGVLGIVTSGTIFLSDVRFLNDASEMSFGRRMFLARLRLFAAERGGAQAEQVATHLGQHADDDLSETTPYAENHCYVASFCSEGDLLSQWRGYAAATAGGGYSVGFRAAELMKNAVIDEAKPVGVAGVGLYKVLYDLTAQETLIDRVLDVCFAAAEGVSHSSAWLYLANNLLGLVIPAIVPQIKAPVFQEEQEWRLVAWGRSGVRFRLSRDGIVPYLACRISMADSVRLPILEVHVGPTERSRLNRLAILEVLRAQSYPHGSVSVIDSGIPLRF